VGSQTGLKDKELADLDELIESITVDAYGDDEQLWKHASRTDGTVPPPGWL
jgi:hypothetical protein